jgi:glycosyltransferase involved in cell wall biosynthesis
MNLPDDVEIIFVDDGSDPPLNYRMGLKNFTIYYTNDKRPWTQGLARNLGASKAIGEYLFFTDIDHILTKEAIEAVRNFEGDKMVFRRMFGILNQHGQIINDVESVLKFGLSQRRFRQRGLNGGFHGNTYAIKKTVFQLLGGYDPKYCESGFHVGKRYMSEERNFNNKYDRRVIRGKLQPPVIGPNIYVFPTSKFRQDGDNNPYGLFHSLSLEQIPQPMKS